MRALVVARHVSQGSCMEAEMPFQSVGGSHKGLHSRGLKVKTCSS